VVAIGCVLRVQQWLHERAYWLDELLLLLALRVQRVDQVLEPLRNSQSAPVGWLIVEHGALRLSGGDERGMRLLPLLFGCAALVVIALLARTLLGGPAALVATALTAVSPSLIRYSNELKQYSSDVFWVPAVLLFGCRFALRQRQGGGRWSAVLLGATAAVAIWFSDAALLTAAGVFVALGLRALVGRRWRELGLLVVVSVPFAVGLAANYVLVLRETSNSANLPRYWARAFPAQPLTWSGGLTWSVRRAAALAQNPLGIDAHPVVALTLLLAGVVVLALRRVAALPVLLIPVAVFVAAGIARLYPLSDRLALFLVPLVAMALAAPLELALLAGGTGRPSRRTAVPSAAGVAVVAAVTLAVLATPQVTYTARAVGRPVELEESRTAMAYVAAHRARGDLVLVDGRAGWAAARWYAPRIGMGAYRLILLQPPRDTCAHTWLGADLRRPGGPRRVWLVDVHTVPAEARWFEEHLRRFGPEADRLGVPGVQVVRFDRSAVSAASADAPARCIKQIAVSG
jgi:uncharacterized membrane protein